MSKPPKTSLGPTHNLIHRQQGSKSTKHITVNLHQHSRHEWRTVSVSFARNRYDAPAPANANVSAAYSLGTRPEEPAAVPARPTESSCTFCAATPDCTQQSTLDGPQSPIPSEEQVHWWHNACMCMN